MSVVLEQFKNAPTPSVPSTAWSTLSAGINNTDTSLTVVSAAAFPTSPQFRLLIDNELILVTGVSGTTFTISRGVEGTTAASHSSGVSVYHVLTSAALTRAPGPMTAKGDITYLDANGAPAALAIGAAGTVLTVSSALPAWVAPDPSTVVLTGTYASLPAAGTAGRLYFPSDGYYIFRDNGSTWDRWGPVHYLVDPALQTFSWVNQGSATISTVGGVVQIYQPTSSASVAIRKKSKTGSYTITAMVSFAGVGVGQVQLGFRESSSGKLTAIAALGNGVFEIQKWNSATSWSGNYTSYSAFDNYYYHNTPLWLRIVDDGANRKYYHSSDGVIFRLAHSVGRTDFLTSDEVYFGANRDTSGSDVYLNLWSWEES